MVLLRALCWAHQCEFKQQCWDSLKKEGVASDRVVPIKQKYKFYLISSYLILTHWSATTGDKLVTKTWFKVASCYFCVAVPLSAPKEAMKGSLKTHYSDSNQGTSKRCVAMCGCILNGQFLKIIDITGHTDGKTVILAMHIISFTTKAHFLPTWQSSLYSWFDLLE